MSPTQRRLTLLIGAALAVMAFSVPAVASAAPPAVTIYGAGQIGAKEATMHGTVDPEGQATTYQFIYWLPGLGWGRAAPNPAGNVGSGSEPVYVNYTATDLIAGQNYNFRLTATNASGTTYKEGSFESLNTDVPFEVLDTSTEEPFESCGEVVVEGEEVEGGCLIEGFEGSFVIGSKEMNFMGCDAAMNVRLGGDGALYGDEPALDCSPQRYPCTTGSSSYGPWVGQLYGLGNGEFAVDMGLCLMPSGGPGVTEWITFGVSLTSGETGGLQGLFQTSEFPGPPWMAGIKEAEFGTGGGDAVYIAEVE